MIVTNQTESKYDVTYREYEEDDDEPESLFYMEKATSLLYEVRLFEDFALIRLLMPEISVPTNRIDMQTFCELFEEFNGDKKELRSIMFGSKPSYILVSKTDDGDG